MRLAWLLMAACLVACHSVRSTAVPPCELDPDQVCVHMARFQANDEQLQELGHQADAQQTISGFTFDERGWRKHWGLALEHQGIPVRLEQSSEWVAPSAEFVAVFSVARATPSERLELAIEVNRPRLGVQFRGRTLLVPRQELYFFSIPPRGSGEPAWVWFLALHGAVLDGAPDVLPCCRPQ